MVNVVAALTPPNKDLISYEDLTTLALDAAIAAENVLAQRPADVPAITRLFATLKDAPGLGVDTQERIQHVSSTALAVYTRALRHTTEEPVRTLDDIMLRIMSVIRSLDESVARPDQLSFAKIRDFCLALHNELLLETYATESSNNWEERERVPSIGLR